MRERLLAASVSRTLEEDLYRILARCEIGDCWEWTGKLTQGGYGTSFAGSHKMGTYRTVLVHRFVFAVLTRQIIHGLDIDHLCKNRKCCNPDHLEPVTRAENIRRGATGKVPAWNRHHPRPNRVKKVCKYGHDKSDAYILKSGARSCRTCALERSRRAYQDRKAA